MKLRLLSGVLLLLLLGWGVWHTLESATVATPVPGKFNPPSVESFVSAPVSEDLLPPASEAAAEVSRFEQIQVIKRLIQPAIKAWERKHAKYVSEPGSESSTLQVELPPADDELIHELRALAQQQAGEDDGDEILGDLLTQDFAELSGPRRIVAYPRSAGGRIDRFEVFVTEPDEETPETTAETTTERPWILSYSFTMHGNEPPEELRHLLRFAEQ